MKKLTAILTAFIMCISMASCSAQSDDDLHYDLGQKFIEFVMDEAVSDEKLSEDPEKTTTSASTTTLTTTTTSTTTRTATTTRKTTFRRTTTTTARTTTRRTTTTAVTTLKSVSRSKYHDYSSIDYYGKYIYLKKSRGIFTNPLGSKWYFYEHSSSAVSAVGINGETSYIDGYGVISGTITDERYLKVTLFSRDSSVVCKGISFTFEQSGEKLSYKTGKTSSGSYTLTADLSNLCFVNGLYEIKGTFSIGSQTANAYIYLFVNCKSDSPADNNFTLCCGGIYSERSDFGSYIKRNEELCAFLKKEGVTPQKALSAEYSYPSAAPANDNDSAYWVSLAHSLMKGNEKLTDSTKLLILHDWITSHLKYDYYKVNVLHRQRYLTADYKIIPSEYVSKNYTGVCLDFSCIYAIMCRECGIPCVVLSNSTHAWNAVYIDGKWREIDLTEDVNRFVDGADTNIVTGTSLYCYRGFLAPKVNSASPNTAVLFCW